ncbi:MAG: amino acid adenylation domain-containing protein, partial [Phaeodactylibacter sp.]|nr:amino acid adenylation domain-containing protein [Phaeodactylibacter sp.]
RSAIQTMEGARLSYAALDRKTDAFAHYLKTTYGLTAQQRVGVCLERSEWLVISYMAILKLAAVYVPIDPTYPPERSNFMIEDSACALVIDEGILANFQAQAEVVVPRPLPDITAEAIAYTIYTSGSTGRPKGVSLSHRNLLNLCRWHNRYYGVSEASSATLYSGIGFDASIWEMSPYLLAGATLFPIEDPAIRLAPEVLCAFLNEHRISHSFLPTTLCQEFAARALTLSDTTVLTGGDSLKLTAKPLFSLFNNYGPTENTVVSTAFDLADWDEKGPIPIGKPIDNTQVYLLDGDGHPVPIGVPGELCLSGESLASGYLNQPQLTAEKFVPHPFEPGAQLYRTGDLGKWLPDGNIVFLGRNDDQIQLRGFRIELGEIEHAILRFSPQITQAVAALQHNGNQKGLAAFYTATGPIDAQDLSRYLDRQLPEYMKPGALCALEEIPLTRNGKIDRAALLAQVPEWNLTVNYVEPQTEVEQELATIWQGILG